MILIVMITFLSNHFLDNVKVIITYYYQIFIINILHNTEIVLRHTGNYSVYGYHDNNRAGTKIVY